MSIKNVELLKNFTLISCFQEVYIIYTYIDSNLIDLYKFSFFIDILYICSYIID